MKTRRAPSIVACLLAAGVAATVVGACRQATGTDKAKVLIVFQPPSIGDRGQEADVHVIATEDFGVPGKGEVVLEAAHGTFPNGQLTITLPLDFGGSAWTVYRCNVFEDTECFGPIEVTGTWNRLVASKTSVLTGTAHIGINGCGRPDAGNPPIHRQCAAASDNECDGTVDTFLTGAGVPGARLNGASGNGFDDDCDGEVDEGCGCPANGQTKDCYLLPVTQVDSASGLPVNWCATNSKGSLDCAGTTTPTWSGVCRGAQPPAESDSCSAGDFDCDGLSSNNAVSGCRCALNVACPAIPIVLAPYPDPRNLTAINGASWLTDPSKVGQTSNWSWTVVGGDCDNVLPYPTFALFSGKDTTVTGARIGQRNTVRFDSSQNPARFVLDLNSKLVSQRASTGSGTNGAVLYPAFGLSGDYLVQGEFDFLGIHFACTQKVEVRAPGIRAEACWDTVGSVDLDLHVARLQGTSCGSHGWESTCSDDCYYANKSPTDWGYTASPDTACHGWSSKQSGTCNNPRLDKDNVSCTRTSQDPAASDFCGPENTNVNVPKDADKFVVGVNFYGGGTSPITHPHVNLYCNGARVLSIGYNPLTGQTTYPAMINSGGGATGDLWNVATIEAQVDGAGNLQDCIVETLPSRHADPQRDGPASSGTSSDFCIDSTHNASPVPFTHNYTSHVFVEAGTSQGVPTGSIPVNAIEWCKH